MSAETTASASTSASGATYTGALIETRDLRKTYGAGAAEITVQHIDKVVPELHRDRQIEAHLQADQEVPSLDAEWVRRRSPGSM